MTSSSSSVVGTSSGSIRCIQCIQCIQCNQSSVKQWTRRYHHYYNFHLKLLFVVPLLFVATSTSIQSFTISSTGIHIHRNNNNYIIINNNRILFIDRIYNSIIPKSNNRFQCELRRTMETTKIMSSMDFEMTKNQNSIEGSTSDNNSNSDRISNRNTSIRRSSRRKVKVEDSDDEMTSGTNARPSATMEEKPIKTPKKRKRKTVKATSSPKVSKAKKPKIKSPSTPSNTCTSNTKSSMSKNSRKKKRTSASPIPTKQRTSKTKSPKSPKSPKTKSTPPLSTTKIILSSDVAKIAPENPWIDLHVPPEELRPSATLTTGQCFNFIVVYNDNIGDNKESDKAINNNNDDRNRKSKKSPMKKSSAWGTHNETEWIGPIQNLVLSIKETKTTTLYRILHNGNSSSSNQNNTTKEEEIETVTQFLQSYFQLEIPLQPLYDQWSQQDSRLQKIASCIPGVRIIRQDPIECMFSFICSSNNNIPRITKMLLSLRQTYGKKLLDIPVRIINNDSFDNQTLNQSKMENMTIYSFPTIEELQSATESSLREMGLGYRAKYIIGTRDLLLTNGGKDQLLSLRNVNSFEKVQEDLVQYIGIGRKVADCISLFSLDQCDAIPVDVHVKNIASRDYNAEKKVLGGDVKSLTPKIYKQVGDLFRDRFGEYAGWAHSLLFVAELPSFRDVLPSDIVEEMDLWKEKQAAEKNLKRQLKKKSS